MTRESCCRTNGSGEFFPIPGDVLLPVVVVDQIYFVERPRYIKKRRRNTEAAYCLLGRLVVITLPLDREVSTVYEPTCLCSDGRLDNLDIFSITYEPIGLCSGGGLFNGGKPLTNKTSLNPN